MGLQIIFFEEDSYGKDCPSIYEIYIPLWAWHRHFSHYLPSVSYVTLMANSLTNIDHKDRVLFLWRILGGFLNILKEDNVIKIWHRHDLMMEGQARWSFSRVDRLYEKYQELLLCDWKYLQLYKTF